MNERKKTEIIITPLGILEFFVCLNGSRVRESSPDTFEFYLNQAKPELSIPAHMFVDDHQAIILECKTVKDIDHFTFVCKWEEGFALKGSPQCGEGLDAQSWENEKYIVMVGTEDYEFLRHRAAQNDKMPASLVSYLGNPAVVELYEDRIFITLKNLSAGDNLSLHYVVAWNKNPESVEISTWFAVDIPHWKILEAAKQS